MVLISCSVSYLLEVKYFIQNDYLPHSSVVLGLDLADFGCGKLTDIYVLNFVEEILAKGLLDVEYGRERGETLA